MPHLETLGVAKIAASLSFEFECGVCVWTLLNFSNIMKLIRRHKYLFICLSFCLSVWLSVCLSVSITVWQHLLFLIMKSTNHTCITSHIILCIWHSSVSISCALRKVYNFHQYYLYCNFTSISFFAPYTNGVCVRHLGQLLISHKTIECTDWHKHTHIYAPVTFASNIF